MIPTVIADELLAGRDEAQVRRMLLPADGEAPEIVLARLSGFVSGLRAAGAHLQALADELLATGLE